MATDFYERQDAARRSTTWLIAMFFLGVVGVVGGTMLVAWLAVIGIQQRSVVESGDYRDKGPEPVGFTLAVGAATLALIVGGTAVKVVQLRAGGGTSVAESLGARRVFPDSQDAVERRLLNVVEEMALASGVPVPPVFILPDEQGINAFAAGYSPSDAVVAVTRGCAEGLQRDELQGVVAHEFSHILNGDMRINIRLIGVLFGILLVGLFGRMMLRHMRFSGGSSRKAAQGRAMMALVAVALVVLGYIGTVIGNLIKAALSRQREYLADASAVQFTRNPGGLAGALKRIGANAGGSKLTAANAAEASHMYFATGLWEGLTNLTATHPPLDARIRRLEPQWDGAFPPARGPTLTSSGLAGRAVGLVGGPPARQKVPIAVMAHASDQVGEPTERHRRYASALVESLPEAVREAAHAPYGARAVVFALLADRNAAVREKQLAQLHELARGDVYELTLKLLPTIDELNVAARLPLVDMSLSALRAMSATQYREFLRCFEELVRADEKLGIFEWTLSRVLLRHLRPQFEKTAAVRTAYYALQRVGPQCSVLLSALAYADNRREHAEKALARGAAKLPGVNVQLLAPEDCGLSMLSNALEELARVAHKKRRLLVDACAACISTDREVTVAEAELLRGICDMLDCPMPPLLPGGPAANDHDGETA